MKYLFFTFMVCMCLLGIVLTLCGLLMQNIDQITFTFCLLGFIGFAACFVDGLIKLEKRG